MKCNMKCKLFFLIVLVAVCVLLFGCKAKNPVSPTPITCQDINATNNGGLLPCVYPPRPVQIGGVGFADMKPGNFAGVIFPVKDYAGMVEVQVNLDQEGTHLIRLMLVNKETNIIIKSVVAPITGSGVISLPHDGAECIAFVRNDGTSVLSGKATFVYKIN